MGHDAVGSDAPRSIAHRINAERLMLVGWSRAILLQFAHPLIAAAIHEHSTFRSTPAAPIHRLHQTIRAMLSLTFADREGRDATLANIRAIHRRIHGTLPIACGRFPAGTRYSAEDPALLLWVHATLMESLPLVYDLLVAPLDDSARDGFCDEAAEVAVALGTDSNDVPRAWSDIHLYMERMYTSGEIAVGEHARQLARSVLRPPLSSAIAPIRWMNWNLTVGLLPEHVRAAYGFPWTARHQQTFRAMVRTVRATRRILPDTLALWPDARGTAGDGGKRVRAATRPAG